MNLLLKKASFFFNLSFIIISLIILFLFFIIKTGRFYPDMLVIETESLPHDDVFRLWYNIGSSPPLNGGDTSAVKIFKSEKPEKIVFTLPEKEIKGLRI